MAKTFTEVDTRRAATNNETPAQTRDEQQLRQREDLRQQNQGRLALIVAPIAVAAAAGAALLTIRSLRNSNDRKNRRRK